MSDAELQLKQLLNRIALTEVLIVGLLIINLISVSFGAWVVMMVGQLPDRLLIMVMVPALILFGVWIWRISLGARIADLRREIEVFARKSPNQVSGE